MYTANDAVTAYLLKWDKRYAHHNHDPVKFIFRTDLNSGRDLLRCYPHLRHLMHTLDHLTVNSMDAISGMSCEIPELMERWVPDAPGEIGYRTFDQREWTVIEVEDNGCGIDPGKVIEAGRQIGAEIDGSDQLKVVNQVFQPDISTKGTNGLGLLLARLDVENLGGRIVVRGTAYVDSGKVRAVGDYDKSHPGTVMRIELPEEIPVP